MRGDKETRESEKEERAERESERKHRDRQYIESTDSADSTDTQAQTETDTHLYTQHAAGCCLSCNNSLQCLTFTLQTDDARTVHGRCL